MEIINKILAVVGMWELIAMGLGVLGISLSFFRGRDGADGVQGPKGAKGENGKDGKMSVDTLLDEEIRRLMARMDEISSHDLTHEIVKGVEYPNGQKEMDQVTIEKIVARAKAAGL